MRELQHLPTILKQMGEYMLPITPKKTSHKLNPLSGKKVMGNEPRIFVARGFHFFLLSLYQKKKEMKYTLKRLKSIFLDIFSHLLKGSFSEAITKPWILSMQSMQYVPKLNFTYFIF